jgi:hypothetical protein
MDKSKHIGAAAVTKDRDSLLSTVVGTLRKRPVLALMIVNIALGAAWMIRTQPHPFSDYYAYFKLAGGILDEHQFGYPLPTARRLPGYPALLAVLMLVSRSFLWLGTCNLLLNAALLPIVHRLTMSLSSENTRVALIATTLCAFNPTFVHFSPIIASEHLFVLLFFSSLLVHYSTRLRPNTRTVLSGAILGLAVLTRGEAAFYAPVVLFVAWITARGDCYRKLARTAVLLAVVIAVTLPWAVRNWIVIGPGVGLSTVSGVNFYYGHNSNQYGYHSLRNAEANIPNEVDRQREWFGRGVAYLRMDPSRLLNDVATGTDQLLVMSSTYAVRAGLVVRSTANPDRMSHRRKFPWGSIELVTWFYPFLAILAALGLLFVRRIGWRNCVIIYGIAFLNWVCFAVVFWGKPRFRYTTEVVMCLLAAYTLSSLWDVIYNTLRRKRL